MCNLTSSRRAECFNIHPLLAHHVLQALNNGKFTVTSNVMVVFPSVTPAENRRISPSPDSSGSSRQRQGFKSATKAIAGLRLRSRFTMESRHCILRECARTLVPFCLKKTCLLQLPGMFLEPLHQGMYYVNYVFISYSILHAFTDVYTYIYICIYTNMYTCRPLPLSGILTLAFAYR